MDITVENSMQDRFSKDSIEGRFHVKINWPKEVDSEDPESVERFQKRVQRSQDYIEEIKFVATLMEDAVLQNNTLHFFEQYFEPPKELKLKFNCWMIMCNGYKRQMVNQEGQAGNISLRADETEHMAVVMGTGESYIWSEGNFNEPLMILKPFFEVSQNMTNQGQQGLPSEAKIMIIEYHPKDHRLGGGLSSGHVAIWDPKNGGPAIKISGPEQSHRGAVTGFKWISSRSEFNFFTAGEDGKVKWWDISSLSGPADEVDAGVPITTLEYDENMPLRYTIGTADGSIICGKRRTKTQEAQFLWTMKVGDCGVFILERNPGFPKIFFTLNWQFLEIWSETCRKSPILRISSVESQITSAKWSPTRPSLILLGREDGHVSLWDLKESRFHELNSLRLDLRAITAISFQSEGEKGGELFFAAAKNGTLYACKISEDWSKMDPAEKTKLSEMWDLEVNREKIIETKEKEVTLVEKLSGLDDYEYDGSQLFDPEKNHRWASAYLNEVASVLLENCGDEEKGEEA